MGGIRPVPGLQGVGHTVKGVNPMDVEEAIRTLVAVRAYEERPVSEGIVRRILEAGRLSASASNRQPWHFVVVENRGTLRQLGEVAETGPYIAEAALAIVV